MEVPFVLTCDYASISDQGKLSALGIFETMLVASVPAVHPVLYLAFELSLSASEVNQPFQLSVKVVDADGGTVLSVSGELKVEGQARPGHSVKIPRVIAINMMPIRETGRYAFDIFINNHRMNGTAVDVVLAGKADGSQPPGLRL